MSKNLKRIVFASIIIALVLSSATLVQMHLNSKKEKTVEVSAEELTIVLKEAGLGIHLLGASLGDDNSYRSDEPWVKKTEECRLKSQQFSTDEDLPKIVRICAKAYKEIHPIKPDGH